MNAAVSLLILVLPLLTYVLWWSIDPRAGGFANLLAPTASSITIYALWLSLQVALQIRAPGKVRQGVYKLNGWFSFWATLAVVAVATYAGWISPTLLYDQFGPLLTTANIFAFAFSLFLYRKSVRNMTHGAVRDYFLGKDLNPRIGGFDLKFFFESRPGLILWVLMNFSFAAKQYELHGRLTTPMILVNAFQFLYVADYFYNEESILTTWDIKHENFGWMLCWGNLVWVPFIFSLQTHYLVHYTAELPTIAIAGIAALNLAGYAIFRGANRQKHRFRNDPETRVWGKRAEYIPTARGTRLLTSGWWGIARHMNYLGDLMMALAWSLSTGLAHPVPYFYFLYMTILLVHREWRDNAMCREKYGKDWEAYCRRVRWRILPGVY